jgi:hypothetical protein
MRSLLVILIYTGSFMGFFFLFSIIGLLWSESYHSIITNHNWFGCYSLLFGWWLAMFPTREYYMHHELYFKEYL